MVNEGRHIPNRLKIHRKIAGFRQQDVAYYIGHKSSSRIIKWEKGKATPGLQNLIKLSILYGTLVEELYRDFIIIQKDILAERKRKTKTSKGQNKNHNKKDVTENTKRKQILSQ